MKIALILIISCFSVFSNLSINKLSFSKLQLQYPNISLKNNIPDSLIQDTISNTENAIYLRKETISEDSLLFKANKHYLLPDSLRIKYEN